MRTEIRNNGIEDCTVVVADENKELYNNFLESRAGSECWLGYIHYDKNGILLDPPYMLTVNDFTEVDKEDEQEQGE